MRKHMKKRATEGKSSLATHKKKRKSRNKDCGGKKGWWLTWFLLSQFGNCTKKGWKNHPPTEIKEKVQNLKLWKLNDWPWVVVVNGGLGGCTEQRIKWPVIIGQVDKRQDGAGVVVGAKNKPSWPASWRLIPASYLWKKIWMWLDGRGRLFPLVVKKKWLWHGWLACHCLPIAMLLANCTAVNEGKQRWPTCVWDCYLVTCLGEGICLQWIWRNLTMVVWTMI